VSLLTRLNVGGPAQQVLLLHRHLPPRLPAVLAAGRPPTQEGELSAQGLEVRHVPLVRPVRPVTDAAALAAVTRLLAATRPGVLHTHMAKAGAVGRLAATLLPRRRRPRVVHTFHGHVLDGYFGAGRQRAFVELERWLARRSDLLVAVSEEVRDELLELRIGRPGQYEVIPLGIDLDRYEGLRPTGALRRAVGVGPEVPLAGVLGRLVPVKDHATLLEALARLPRLHLAVLGDGERRHELTALARQLGVAERAHFTGWWQDVPGALGDLDVVVLSSRHEGTPVALIEALAAGRPVVATNVGGVPSVVEDGVTGWLCPPGDAEALAAALEGALADPAAARARAERGRERVVARFGVARMVADHVALYDGLLGR
jgi:glycosyltransferase involved in cell wall biosynthesis